MTPLSLREPALSDAETLASWGADVTFCQHAGWSGAGDPAGLLAWWRANIARPALGTGQLWAEAAAANSASTRILRRLGMRRTHDGGPTHFLGRPTYHQRFAISRSDWPAT